MSETEKQGIEVPPARDDRPLWAHVVPFVAWLFLMHMLGDPAGWKYAARSAACLALFLWLRPWQWYPRLNLRHIPLALLVGAVVFVVWVAPETRWMDRLPQLRDLYMEWAVMPFGKFPEPLQDAPYAPAVAGWPLAIIRLLGSALVIATIEEFFWRGFAYRWVLKPDFLKVDPGEMDVPRFLLVCLVFGFEHDRWLVGAIAGVAYGWMYWKTRDLWAAALAHVVTNFLLGVYVLKTGAWQFW